MSDKTNKEPNKWEAIAEKETIVAERQEIDADVPELNYASHKELEEQLNALDIKYNEAISALRYTQAEFDNFRKRSERDVSHAYKYGPEKLINELLSVVDSLEKSLELMTQTPSDLQHVKEGMELTYKLLKNILEKFSVKQLNPVGEVFNPSWHEAMTVQEQEGRKAGTVLSVLQKGYTLHERLLRPALVIVAK